MREFIELIANFEDGQLVGRFNHKEIDITVRAKNIKELEEMARLALGEKRKICRELNLKIPKILSSVCHINIFMKPYMKGGKRERFLHEYEKKSAGDTKD